MVARDRTASHPAEIYDISSDRPPKLELAK